MRVKLTNHIFKSVEFQTSFRLIISTFAHMDRYEPLSKLKNAKGRWFLISTALIVLSIYLLPHYFNTDSSVFLVHDNLDSNVVWNTVLANDPNVFSPHNTQIEGILNSLPSGVYRSEFTYITFLYYFFSPLAAYNLNAIFVHLIGFLSAFLFLHFTMKQMPLSIKLGLSLCFALLPFRTAGLCSVAGQPIIALAAVWLSQRKNLISSFTIMLLFPLFSDLFLVTTFTLFGLCVYAANLLIVKKALPTHLLLGILIITLSSILIHYKLFELVFLDGFTSHRTITRSALNAHLNFNGFIGTSIMTALKGQYHFHTFPWVLSIPIWIAGFMLFMKDRAQIKLISLGLISIIALGFANQIWTWIPFANLVSKFSGMGSFNFRFYALIPFFSFLTLVFCFSDCNKSLVKSIYAHISLMAIIIFTFFPVFMTDVNGSTFLESPFYTNFIQKESSDHQSFSAYYKKDVFNKITTKLENIKLGQKIACFGFAPAMAQMNDIKTVDGYFGIYPASYHRQWSKMLDQETQNNFSSWGNQCYLFSNELSSNSQINEIRHLSINLPILQKIGAEGILSRYPITKIGDKHISPIKVLTNTKNFEVMYFYPLSD